MLAPADAAGFKRGRNLEKIGLKAQDTSELFFTDMRVPVANRLGGEGEGFKMLMTKLSQERLTQAVRSICVCEAAIEWTVDYTSERKAFGRSEEHTSELQSLMRISYAVFCLKKKKTSKKKKI